MQMKPKAAIILDTRRKKGDNTYPVKLRITFERKQKYYPTEYSFTDEQFTRAMFGKRQTESEKESKRSIQAYEDKATKIINKLNYFDWNKFEKLYYTNRTAKDTLNTAFTHYATGLRKDGRINTAVTYECARKA